MSNIKIVALVTVKPEYTETLAAQFKELVKASRAEEGNWKSQAAIDEHNASAHFQAFVQSVDGKTEALEIVLMNEVAD